MDDKCLILLINVCLCFACGDGENASPMVDADMGREFDQSLESVLDADIMLDSRLTDALGAREDAGQMPTPDAAMPMRPDYTPALSIESTTMPRDPTIWFACLPVAAVAIGNSNWWRRRQANQLMLKPVSTWQDRWMA